MSRRSYPRIGLTTGDRAKSIIPCDNGGNEIPANSTFFRVDVQTNWFRGDDEVVNVCVDCAGKRGNKASGLDPYKLAKAKGLDFKPMPDPHIAVDERIDLNAAQFQEGEPQAIAEACGLKLLQHTEIHYSLRGEGWQLNIYPSNQRLYWSTALKLPFLRVPHPWMLLDVMYAVRLALGKNP